MLTAMHVETVGSGPRVVLVHGSVGSGWSTWWAQRPLAERFTLVVPDRPGSPPNPPVEHVDFEEQAPLVAELLEDGAHLVGHSYGGVISLYAAALRPDSVRSLMLIEPPAFGVALDDPTVAGLVEELHALWDQADSMEPAVFLSEFSSRIIGRRIPATMELPPDALFFLRLWTAAHRGERLAARELEQAGLAGPQLSMLLLVALHGPATTTALAAGFNELLAAFVSRA